MGNRGGRIHNANREIVPQYASRRWIACLLEFKGRRRTVMSPGHYTELFFLDEATALAAGHRPCAECRRDRFRAFQDAWVRSGQTASDADAIDKDLHHSRLDAGKRKRTYTAPLHSLPDGCFVAIDSGSYLLWSGALLLWSPARYVSQRDLPSELCANVLTPEPIVRCLRHGYRPVIHASALALVEPMKP